MTRVAVLALVALVVLVVLLGGSTTALAEDERAGAVGTVAAAALDSHVDASYSGALVFRFGSVMGLEVQTTAVPTLQTAGPASVSGLVAPQPIGGITTVTVLRSPTITNTGGRAVLYTTSARLAIPTTSARLTPYFIAGGGVAAVRRTATLVYTPIPIVLPPGLSPLIVPPPQTLTASDTDLALTLGGGLSVRVQSHLSIDADLRYFRLLGATDQNVGRFGVGLGYWF